MAYLILLFQAWGECGVTLILCKKTFRDDGLCKYAEPISEIYFRGLGDADRQRWWVRLLYFAPCRPLGQCAPPPKAFRHTPALNSADEVQNGRYQVQLDQVRRPRFDLVASLCPGCKPKTLKPCSWTEAATAHGLACSCAAAPRTTAAGARAFTSSWPRARAATKA